MESFIAIFNDNNITNQTLICFTLPNIDEGLSYVQLSTRTDRFCPGGHVKLGMVDRLLEYTWLL